MPRKSRWALGSCAHEIGEMAADILPTDADRKKASRILGVEERTLDAKIRYGRFSAAEFDLVARSMGYSVKLVKEDDLIG